MLSVRASGETRVVERSEEFEESAAEPLAGTSPAAAALVLGRASRANKAIDAKAVAFLDEQTDLIRLQKEHLHEQRQLILSRLRLGRWKDRVTLTLQGLTVLVGLAIAAAIGVMAWQAHEDHGLAIQAFSTPPDLAQRGLTGQVVAARVLDRLSELQAQTVSARPASTYANDWGDDVKVEIPETGVSLGELNRWLREWLGHETRVTGEVVHVATGVSVTVRAGDAPGKTVTGAEGDIDGLVSQAAEALYAQTQPYRYAVFLASHNRAGDALALYKSLAKAGSVEDRKWAYTGWATMLVREGDNAEAAAIIDEGMRAGLDLYQSGGLATQNLAEMALGHSQAGYDNIRLQKKLSPNEAGNLIVSPEIAKRIQVFAIAWYRGDKRTAAAAAGALGDYGLEGLSSAINLREESAEALILDHDVAGGLRLSRSAGSIKGPLILVPAPLLALYELSDWPSLATGTEQLAAGLQSQGALSKDPIERGARPVLAIAYARLGRIDQAKAVAADLPSDCEPCLDARGWVAALAGDRTGSDRWFAAVERMAPEIPAYDSDWGEALLAEGDPGGAIAKLALAHAKGPNFADPLELWGEALMRKGDFASAIAKFAEADKDAPKWGRNHLLWGEALMLSGRYREARAQYETAKDLDLSKPDRATLDVLLERTSKGPLHG
jgi:tetratricopeptide (TPR) repeat protein